MAGQYRHGLRNKFYVSADLIDSDDGPTWVEFKKVESVGNENARDEAEVVNRDGEDKLYGVGKRSQSYETPATWAPGDTASALIMAAYNAGTPIAVADMDGDIETAGTQGVMMDVCVTQAPKPSELNAYDVRTFGFKPSAESDYPPTNVVIAAPTTTTP